MTLVALFQTLTARGLRANQTPSRFYHCTFALLYVAATSTRTRLPSCCKCVRTSCYNTIIATNNQPPGTSIPPCHIFTSFAWFYKILLLNYILRNLLYAPLKQNTFFYISPIYEYKCATVTTSICLLEPQINKYINCFIRYTDRDSVCFLSEHSY